MAFYRQIETVLSERTGRTFKIENRQAIDGGSINVAECLSDANRSYFIKTNLPHFLESFEAEKDSLDLLASSSTIRVPKPIAYGITDNRAYLILEYIQHGPQNANSWSEFGRQLAALRKTLYNLYHCLNHYNLFGSEYASQAQAMTDELLS